MQGITAAQLTSLGLRHLSGPSDRKALRVSQPEASTADALVFLDRAHLPELQQMPAILVVDSSLSEHSFADKNVSVFLCEHLKSAMIGILPAFTFKPTASAREKAFIDPSAKLGKNVQISPFAVIEAEAVIEDEAFIGPGVVIEVGAFVGRNTRLYGNVVIGHHCRVGKDCIIHANSTIGSDGFGFIPDPKGLPQKIPQVGIVIIEDHVEIGGNCAIDRATIGATLIQEGCKLDNFVHVAHNCVLGKGGLYAAKFSVAGSSKIGSHFMCGGHCVVADHVTITDHVSLGGRSTVTKDITEPGAYTGYPLEPMKDGLKTIANLRELTQLRKDLGTIKKYLNLEEEK